VGEVSSIPDANTVFEGQHINGQTHREDREETPIEERTQRRETLKITKGDHRTDNRREIKGSLRYTTSEGHNTL
jgi:hypothetical protein